MIFDGFWSLSLIKKKGDTVNPASNHSTSFTTFFCFVDLSKLLVHQALENPHCQKNLLNGQFFDEYLTQLFLWMWLKYMKRINLKIMKHFVGGKCSKVCFLRMFYTWQFVISDLIVETVRADLYNSTQIQCTAMKFCVGFFQNGNCLLIFDGVDTFCDLPISLRLSKFLPKLLSRTASNVTVCSRGSFAEDLNSIIVFRFYVV